MVLAAAACGSPGSASDADVDVVTIPGGEAEIGTGTTDFEPIEPEGELGLVAGPQGGFHFIAHARIRDMSPGDPAVPPSTPSTRFYAYKEDGRRIDKNATAYRLAYEAVGTEGWYQLPSGRILQILNEEEPGIYGTRVRIEVVIRDELGHEARDERWIVVFDYCQRFPDECLTGRPAH